MPFKERERGQTYSAQAPIIPINDAVVEAVWSAYQLELGKLPGGDVFKDKLQRRFQDLTPPEKMAWFAAILAYRQAMRESGVVECPMEPTHAMERAYFTAPMPIFKVDATRGARKRKNRQKMLARWNAMLSAIDGKVE